MYAFLDGRWTGTRSARSDRAAERCLEKHLLGTSCVGWSTRVRGGDGYGRLRSCRMEM
jgi:hypothetical protein